MDRVKRIWYLSPMRAAKVQGSLRIRAVSPEPPLLAHTSSESRGTFRQKARSLAPLNGKLKFVMTECSKTQIRLTGLKSNWQPENFDYITESSLQKRRSLHDEQMFILVQSVWTVFSIVFCYCLHIKVLIRGKTLEVWCFGRMSYLFTWSSILKFLVHLNVFLVNKKYLLKRYPPIVQDPFFRDFLKVNTLFSAITAKAIENGFSAQEVRDDYEYALAGNSSTTREYECSKCLTQKRMCSVIDWPWGEFQSQSFMPKQHVNVSDKIILMS